MSTKNLFKLGNEHLLTQLATGFLCSNDAGEEIQRMCSRWALMQSESGNLIICGNHGSIEKKVFEVLLSGTQPIILILARGIPETIEDSLLSAIENNRLLLASPFQSGVTRMTKETALIKNDLIIRLSHKTVVGYERPGGQLEMLLAKTNKDLIYLAEADT